MAKSRKIINRCENYEMSACVYGFFTCNMGRDEDMEGRKVTVTVI